MPVLFKILLIFLKDKSLSCVEVVFILDVYFKDRGGVIFRVCEELLTGN